MKRLHVNLAVTDLDATIRFYSTLFGTAPSVVQPDYAKWLLEDPRVNFAVSTRGGGAPGLDHLGLQVEDRAELAEVQARLDAADAPVLNQGAVTCCYANSEKSWITDPQGIAWEAFLTLGQATVYGDGGQAPAAAARLAGAPAAKPAPAPAPAPASTCCGPAVS